MINEISKCQLLEKMRDRILILDGAMGTMIQQLDLTEEDFRGDKEGIVVEGRRIRLWDHPMNLKGNNDILNITRPEVVETIHRQYIEAGADIIETNTFSGTSVSQQDYGCGEYVYEINLQGARIARNAVRETAGARVLVAGSMGPTVKTLSLSPEVNRPEYRPLDFDAMAEAYKVQVRGLIDGGADLLLVETVYDGLNAKAALYAIARVQEEKGTDLPVMISATVNDKSGRLLSGQKIEALYTALARYKPISFGLNCSFGAKDLMPFIEQLAVGSGQWGNAGKGIPCAVSVYPNAGLPNEMGGYDERPETTAACLREIALKGYLNIAGGCCGTTPEHIRAIKAALSDCPPRPLAQIRGEDSPEEKGGAKRPGLVVSGLENLLIDREESNFINVGERTNVAGSAKFAGLIKEKAYERAAGIARKQIEDGATIIDINMDDAMLDSAHEMETFLRVINNDPDIAKVPFMIDSSGWETILAGLKNCGGKAIVNSISLKEGEAEFIRKAREIYLLGAAVIVMAFDERGQAVDFERKIEICRRAYDILTRKVEYAPEDIIFDVNILTIATGLEEHDNYAVDFIKAVKWIKENLPGCKTSGGVSNLSFAFRGNNKVREAMHSVFLYHAIRAGLDMAIVNPSMLQVYDDIEPELLRRVEAVVLNDPGRLPREIRPEAETDVLSPTEALIEIAERIKRQEQAAKKTDVPGENIRPQGALPQWREKSVEERLSYSLMKGITEYMETDLAQALEKYAAPVEIIEGPLMEGMDRVGELFAQGKMFLPQVVKSAKAMKTAVSLLQPEIEKQNEHAGGGTPRGKVVIATAKGDVHDIGKNIVGIVLSCNNFEVIDLGVMVDNETIIEQAIAHKADMIGISGLITPSLVQMEALCRMLEERKEEIKEKVGHYIPLNVGGATTSSVHTAVKLAPLYNYCVVYGGDASRTAGICKRLMEDMREGSFIARIRKEQEEIRRTYYNRNIRFVSVEEARSKAPVFSPGSFSQPEKYGENNMRVRNLYLGEVVPYLDWTALLNFWGFKGKYPEIIYSNKEADKLYDIALDRIGTIIEGGEFEAGLTLEFFDAYANENDRIVILKNIQTTEEEERSGAARARIADMPLEEREILAELPMPRQRDVGSGFRSVADYFPRYPALEITSRIGLFALKVRDRLQEKYDPKEFEYLLRQSLCARFAEGMACWMQDMVACGQHIIRPAFGYPLCPDHSLKKTVFDILRAREVLDMELTESFAIIPVTSICGMLVAHPQAEYFGIRTE